MNKPTIVLITAILLYSGFSTTHAQYIRLTPSTSKHALYVDLDRTFNYNLYEQYRWGIGSYYVWSIDGTSEGRQLMADAYGAYGTYDLAIKYGGHLQYKMGGRHQLRFMTGFQHDIEQAGSRNMETYQLTSPSLNASYVASRFSLINRATLGVRWHLNDHASLLLQYRHSTESPLFGTYGPFHPYRDGIALYTQTTYDELHSTLYFNQGWKFDLLAGQYSNGQSLYARLLAQYDHSHKFNNNHGKLSTFAQIGLSTPSTPFVCMFDLSGTFGSYYFFQHAFLTVPTNYFMSNEFAQLCLTYTQTKPWWNIQLSKPRLFLQLNTMWGCIAQPADHAFENGMYAYSLAENRPVSPNDFNLSPVPGEAVLYHTPTHALIEPAAGITHLLRWNYINLGLSVAYQITPASAPYHQTEFWQKFAILGVADLLFE